MSGLEVLGGVAAAQQLASCCLDIVKLLSRIRNAPDDLEAAIAGLEDSAKVLTWLGTDLSTPPTLPLASVQDIIDLRDKAQALVEDIKWKLTYALDDSS